MEKALKWRERVIDTIINGPSDEDRIKPMTEHVDFYTQAGTYKRGLRNMLKEEEVIVGQLEPLIK